MLQADVLALTEDLPQRTFQADEVVFVEGERSQSVLVLVDGELEVERGGAVISRQRVPGEFVGEIGALLEQPRSATVTAVVPSVVREIGDPDEFFAAHPQLGLAMARQLAQRLHRVTAYVADVQRHFGDRGDHLGMFGDLLARIAGRSAIDIQPGSDRSPDY